MHRTRGGLLVLLFTFLTPAIAVGQASVTGVVRDASGAVLPGVTVEVSSSALIEKVRTTVTDGAGLYRIVDLRPGEYTVNFALTGFSTVRREGIRLQGTMTVTLDAELRVGAVEETVTVTGATPLVDVQSVQQQRVLSREVIDTLPTGRTTLNVAALIPGMQLSTTFSGEGQDVGGNTGEVQQTLTIHGSRGGDMRRMVDGLSMQSQGTSVSAFAANAGMVQEVVVDSAAGSAEQSAGGVRMNIIPRDGGNIFAGSFFVGGHQRGTAVGQYRPEAARSAHRFLQRLQLCIPRCARRKIRHQQASTHGPATVDSLEGLWWRRRACDPNAVAEGRQAPVRFDPRHMPTRYRRSCNRDRPHDRVREPTQRHRSRSIRPCPTSHSRSPTATTRCGERCGIARCRIIVATGYRCQQGVVYSAFPGRIS